jgi:hypothetical protein
MYRNLAFKLLIFSLLAIENLQNQFFLENLILKFSFWQNFVNKKKRLLSTNTVGYVEDSFITMEFVVIDASSFPSSILQLGFCFLLLLDNTFAINFVGH